MTRAYQIPPLRAAATTQRKQQKDHLDGCNDRPDHSSSPGRLPIRSLHTQPEELSWPSSRSLPLQSSLPHWMSRSRLSRLKMRWSVTVGLSLCPFHKTLHGGL